MSQNSPDVHPHGILTLLRGYVCGRATLRKERVLPPRRRKLRPRKVGSLLSEQCSKNKVEYTRMGMLKTPDVDALGPLGKFRTAKARRILTSRACFGFNIRFVHLDITNISVILVNNDHVCIS